ncbi:MAG: chemotaxis protein CheD [bacterium]
MQSQPLTFVDGSSSPATTRIVVGVADCAVTDDANARIITYALGSCLGITVFDPVAGVGAMLHVMLPDSTIHRDKTAVNPAMFVDTGVPHLFREAYRLGANKRRIVVKVAGGATAQGGTDMFEIGKRNMVALRKILWKNGVMIKAQDVGGYVSRTITLDVATGGVTLRIAAVDSSL